MNFCEVATMLQNELMEMRHKLKSGETSIDKAAMDLTIISGVDKLQNTILKTMLAERKLKRRFRQNLIPPIDIETEKIECPDQGGKYITRNECLDFSGTHPEPCGSCKNFAPTRRLLLPETAS